MASEPNALAIDHLLTARASDDDRARRLERELAALDGAALRGSLHDHGARLAFWIDVYNAAVLRQPPDDVGTWIGRLRFFRRPVLTVAGQPLSLDAIEHGILRRSRWKLGLGYAGNPMPSRFERAHRVSRVDPRVHFALNCAAASCPPIAAYDPERIDLQLDVAARSHLTSEVQVEDGRLRVPRIFLWFLGDFGGPAGVRRFLADHGVQGSGRPLRFAPYDWTPTPDRWIPDEPADR